MSVEKVIFSVQPSKAVLQNKFFNALFESKLAKLEDIQNFLDKALYEYSIDKCKFNIIVELQNMFFIHKQNSPEIDTEADAAHQLLKDDISSSIYKTFKLFSVDLYPTVGVLVREWEQALVDIETTYDELIDEAEEIIQFLADLNKFADEHPNF